MSAIASIMRRIPSPVLAVGLLVTGCIGHPALEGDDDTSSDSSSEVSMGVSTDGSEVSGEPGGRDVEAPNPIPTSCADEDAVDELPFAIAWHVQDDDGTTELRVHVQSWIAACDQRTSSVPSEASRVSLELPLDLDVPVRFELGDVHGMAVIAPGAPGSTGPLPEIRFLDGHVEIDAFDGERLIGTLHEIDAPFTGCFEARVCAGEE